jgi:hypothetical protein
MAESFVILERHGTKLSLEFEDGIEIFCGVSDPGWEGVAVSSREDEGGRS